MPDQADFSSMASLHPDEHRSRVGTHSRVSKDEIQSRGLDASSRANSIAIRDSKSPQGRRDDPQSGTPKVRSRSPKGRPPQLESPVRRNSVVLSTQSSSNFLGRLSPPPRTRKHAHVSAADDPFNESNSKARLFHKIQDEIRESVERADQTLAEYDLHRPMSATTEETEEQPTSPLPQDLAEIVPAAERMAVMQLGIHHNENMTQLVDMYNKFEDFMGADDGPDLTSEKEVNEMFSDILAHRQAVLHKVEAARDAAREAAEALLRPDEEPETPVEEIDTDEPKEDAGPPLKEHIRHLEQRISDLQEELEEEHDNYQQMEDAKDQMIKSLRTQLVETQNQMQDLVGKTATEIADSASQVEDTRLHIAYLTLQLRNAREMAAQRVFDAEKWISRDDYEALVRENQAMKAQVRKAQDRVVLEQQKTAEAHEYGRKCLRMSHQAEEKHAAWELRLRETLKERDRDLSKLNYETRLLQSRADKMLHDFEEKQKQMQSDAKDEVQRAVQAMEQQRAVFNEKLLEKDIEMTRLKGKCDDLRDQLNAKALAVKQLAKRKNKADAVSVATETAETQTSWSLLHPGGLEADSKATQTGDVRGTLWRVARRRMAIKALAALDKKNKTMKTLDAAVRTWQADTDARWEEAEAGLRAAQEAVELRSRTLAEVTEALVDVVERLKRLRDAEPGVESKRARVAAALGGTMHALQPTLSEAMLRLGESLRWSERPLQDGGESPEPEGLAAAGLSADDARMFDHMMTKLSQAARVAGEAVEQSTDALLSVKSTVFGETVHHIATARATLEHELNVVARGDLNRHEQVLTAIKTGVSVDERVQTPWNHAAGAGLDVLAGQKAESNALADIVSAWNHQRTDWVKERYKLTHENKDLRLEVSRLSATVDEMRRTAASDSRTEPLVVKWDDPTKMKVELEVFKSLGMEVEGPMREVAGGIVRWWERGAGQAAEIKQMPHGEAPSIFSAGVLLLQAACLAVQRAKELEQKPETGEQQQQAREQDIMLELGVDVGSVDRGVQAELAEPRPPSVPTSDKSTAISVASSTPPVLDAPARQPSQVEPTQPEAVCEPVEPKTQPEQVSQKSLALLKIIGRTAARVRGTVGMLDPGGMRESDAAQEEEDGEESMAEEEEETTLEESEQNREQGSHLARQSQQRPQHSDAKKTHRSGGTSGGTTKQADAKPGSKREQGESKSGKPGQQPSVQVDSVAKASSRKASLASEAPSVKVRREASMKQEAAATRVQRWIRGKNPEPQPDSQADLLHEVAKLQVQAAAEVEEAIRRHAHQKSALEEELARLRAEAAAAEERGREAEALAEKLREAEESAAVLRAELAERSQGSLSRGSRRSGREGGAAAPELAERAPAVDWETWEGLAGTEIPVSRATTKASESEDGGQDPDRRESVPSLGFLQGRTVPGQPRPATSGSEASGDGAEQGQSAVATWMGDMAADAAQRESRAKAAGKGGGEPAPAAPRGEGSSGPAPGAAAERAERREGHGGEPPRDAAPTAKVATGWGGQLAAAAGAKERADAPEGAATRAEATNAQAKDRAAGPQKEGAPHSSRRAKAEGKEEDGKGKEAQQATEKRSSAARRSAPGQPKAAAEAAEGGEAQQARAGASRGGAAPRSSPRGGSTSTSPRGSQRHASPLAETASRAGGAAAAELPAEPAEKALEGGGGVSAQPAASRRGSAEGAEKAETQRGAGAEGRADTEGRADAGVWTEEAWELREGDVILGVSERGFVPGGQEHAGRGGTEEVGQQSENETEVVADILRRRFAALLRDKDRLLEELRAGLAAGQHKASAVSESYTRELRARQQAHALEKEVAVLKKELEKSEAALAPILEQQKTIAALQETVVAAQKEVAAMGAMTSKMANELVEARQQARFHEEYGTKMQREAEAVMSAKAELEETVAELSTTLNALPPTPLPHQQRRRSSVSAHPQPPPRREGNTARALQKQRRAEHAGLGTGTVSSIQISSDGARIVLLDSEEEEEEVESVEQLIRKVDEEFSDLTAGRRAMLDLFNQPAASPRRAARSQPPSADVPPLPISALDAPSPLKPHPPTSGSSSQRGRRPQPAGEAAGGAGEDGRGFSAGREATAAGEAAGLDRLPLLFPPTLPSATRRRTPRTPR